MTENSWIHSINIHSYGINTSEIKKRDKLPLPYKPRSNFWEEKRENERALDLRWEFSHYHLTTTKQVTTQNPSTKINHIKTPTIITFMNSHGCFMKENKMKLQWEGEENSYHYTQLRSIKRSKKCALLNKANQGSMLLKIVFLRRRRKHEWGFMR